MTTLANAKHEAVELAYIADPERVGWHAYRSVYPKSSQHAAETAWARMLKNAEFSARIAELALAAALARVGQQESAGNRQMPANAGRSQIEVPANAGRRRPEPDRGPPRGRRPR